MADDTRHERYDIPNADVLDQDVWAEDENSDAPLECAECGATLGDAKVCSECGTLAPMCSGVCGACSVTPCKGRVEEHS